MNLKGEKCWNRYCYGVPIDSEVRWRRFSLRVIEPKEASESDVSLALRKGGAIGKAVGSVESANGSTAVVIQSYFNSSGNSAFVFLIFGIEFTTT